MAPRMLPRLLTLACSMLTTVAAAQDTYAVFTEADLLPTVTPTHVAAGNVLGSLFVSQHELHDLTGDGDPDLVESQTTALRWRRGLQGFGFDTPVGLLNGTNPIEHRIHDMDGDGDLDLVAGVGGNSPAPTLCRHVLLNDGNGAFSPAPVLSEPDGLAWHDAGDLDGDGLPELIWCAVLSGQIKSATNLGG